MNYGNLSYQEIFDLIKESENPFSIYCEIEDQYMSTHNNIWDNVSLKNKKRTEILDNIDEMRQEMESLDFSDSSDRWRYHELEEEIASAESSFDDTYDDYYDDYDYEKFEKLHNALEKAKYATFDYLEFTNFSEKYSIEEIRKLTNPDDFIRGRLLDVMDSSLRISSSDKILLDRINDDSFSLDKIFIYLSSKDLQDDKIMDAIIDRVKKYECAEDYDLESLKKSPDRLLETMRGIEFDDEPLVANNDFCK